MGEGLEPPAPPPPPPPPATLLNGKLFSPNSGGDLRSDAHQSQIIGGDADVDHTQIIGGGYSQIIGEDISPPGFGTLALTL